MFLFAQCEAFLSNVTPGLLFSLLFLLPLVLNPKGITEASIMECFAYLLFNIFISGLMSKSTIHFIFTIVHAVRQWFSFSLIVWEYLVFPSTIWWKVIILSSFNAFGLFAINELSRGYGYVQVCRVLRLINQHHMNQPTPTNNHGGPCGPAGMAPHQQNPNATALGWELSEGTLNTPMYFRMMLLL